MDAMFYLGNGSRSKNWELRYTLRALQRNFLDLERVFVCGVKPQWLTEAIHIAVPDSFRHSKDANLITKVLAACDAGISAQFLRSADDEMLLLPCHADALLPYHIGDLLTRRKGFWSNAWKERLRLTAEYLTKNNFPALHYDSHIPKIIDRERFKQIMAASPFQRGKGFTIDTLYFNQLGLVNPPKMTGQKITFERPGGNIEQLRVKITGKQYMGYNDAGLTAALKQWMQETYPEPSRFENDGTEFVRGVTFTDTKRLPQIAVVMGSPRSGTSCIAGIVHNLGVSMGKHLKRPNKRNPRGYYEAVALAHICEAIKDRPEVRTQKLRKWMNRRSRQEKTIVGAKYGKLCNYVQEMVDAWHSFKAIAVERPMEEIVASMAKSGLYKHGDKSRMEAWARHCLRNRDRDLAKFNIPTLKVSYHATLANPADTVQRIIDFLGLTPTAAQRAAAIAFVDPNLYRNRNAATPPTTDYCQHRTVCPHSRDCGNKDAEIPVGAPA
jgi:hypothetical protein